MKKWQAMIEKIKRKLFFRRAEKELFKILNREPSGAVNAVELTATYLTAAYLMKMETLIFSGKPHEMPSGGDAAFQLALSCWSRAQNQRRKEKREELKAAEQLAINLKAIQELTAGELYDRLIKIKGGERSQRMEKKQELNGKRPAFFI